jgi:hypothetical protein
MDYTNRNTILNELLGSIIGKYQKEVQPEVATTDEQPAAKEVITPPVEPMVPPVTSSTDEDNREKVVEEKIPEAVEAPVQAPVVKSSSDAEAVTAPVPEVSPGEENGESIASRIPSTEPSLQEVGTVKEIAELGKQAVGPAAESSETERESETQAEKAISDVIPDTVSSTDASVQPDVIPAATPDVVDKTDESPVAAPDVVDQPAETPVSKLDVAVQPTEDTTNAPVAETQPTEGKTPASDVETQSKEGQEPAPNAEAEPDDIPAPTTKVGDDVKPTDITVPAPGDVSEDKKQKFITEITEKFKKVEERAIELNETYKKIIENIEKLLTDPNISIKNKESLIERKTGLKKVLEHTEVVINSLRNLLGTYKLDSYKDDKTYENDKKFFESEIEKFEPFIFGEIADNLIKESEQIIQEAESEINSKLIEAKPVSEGPIVAEGVVPHIVSPAEAVPIVENGKKDVTEGTVAEARPPPIEVAQEQIISIPVESVSKKLEDLVKHSLEIYANIKSGISIPKKDESVISPGAEPTAPGAQVAIAPGEPSTGPEVKVTEPGEQVSQTVAQQPAPGAQPPVVTTVTSEAIQKDKIRELIEKSKKIVDDLKNKQAPTIETRPSEAVAESKPTSATIVTPADTQGLASIPAVSTGISGVSQEDIMAKMLKEAREIKRLTDGESKEAEQALMEDQTLRQPDIGQAYGKKTVDGIISKTPVTTSFASKFFNKLKEQEKLASETVTPGIKQPLDASKEGAESKSILKMPAIGLPTMPKILPSFGTKVSPEGVDTRPPDVAALEPLPIEDYIQHSNQNIEKIFEKSYTQTDAQKFVKKGLEGVKNTGKAVLGSIATNLGFNNVDKIESKPVIEEVEEKFITTPGAILIVDLPNMNQYEESLKKDPEEIKRENTEIQSKQKREQISVKIEPILGTSENELKIETKEFNTPTPTTNTTTNAQLSQVQNTAAQSNIQQMNQSAAQPTGQPTPQPTIQQTSPPTTQPSSQPAIPSLIQKSSQIKQLLEKTEESEEQPNKKRKRSRRNQLE